MAQVLMLNTFKDNRGSLTVAEKEIPFTIRRVYYIYDVNRDAVRAGHRHLKNTQALICVKGSCEIYVNDGEKKQVVVLDSPDKCLILESKDWHKMYKFTPDAVLIVFASEPYDIGDYIDEEYT